MKKGEPMTGMISALKQEVMDFKKETFSILKRIENQTIKTNGRVNSHETDIELLKNETKNCPARIFHTAETKSTFWSRNGVTVAMITNIVVAGLLILQKFGG